LNVKESSQKTFEKISSLKKYYGLHLASSLRKSIGRRASDERFCQETARIMENKYKRHIKIYTRTVLRRKIETDTQ
jgi:hypothetical protein